MTHKGTVTLETERLILRRFTMDDAEAMFRNWGSDTEVARFKGWDPQASIEVARKDIIGMTEYSEQTYRWAVVLKEISEPIGSISAHNIDDKRRSLEVGYTLGSKWWHCRIMTEALGAVVKFFFEEIEVNRIAAKHNATNPRSGGVMLNVGMKQEGTQRQASQTGCDVLMYAILADDYFGSAPKTPEPVPSNVTVLKTSADLMFYNLHISMDTVDWNADVCGAPAWRYIYHTLHSADKWFINPSTRNDEPEPVFHTSGLDWPDNPTDTVLDRDTLYVYYEQVRQKILGYLDSLNDLQLTERPQGCNMTRLGLALSQFRHMYAHTGILNGVTIANTNRYPRVINEGTWRSSKLPEGLYDVEERK